MMKTDRVILIVMDSVGIGALPDAKDFGDEGSNTLGHIAAKIKNFSLPNLQALGLGNISNEVGLPPVENPTGAYGQSAEASPGKDTTTGHWEISGLIMDQPFPSYSEGFPTDFIAAFEKKIGIPTIGNYAASGTVIIESLGDIHVSTGFPIVYTSADSVFQIAMHEDVIPIKRQYEICQIARDMLKGDLAVGRVIARPFTGKDGNYTRTANRRDFSLQPPGKTVLRLALEEGWETMAVGKIWDIFAEDGISQHIKTADNQEGITRTIEYIRSDDKGLIFTNLVDFDMHFGHRRDPEGYGKCLQEFDARLPEIQAAMQPGDVLMITADHGNDPTFKGTDHTREYVPILVYGENITPGAKIGTRKTFADMGATIADFLELPATRDGKSFVKELTDKPNVSPKAEKPAEKPEEKAADSAKADSKKEKNTTDKKEKTA